MLTYKRITLYELNADSHLLATLHAIFQSTLNEELSLREFRQYYFAQHPSAMDITLMLDGNEVVGFCSAAFYPSQIGNKRMVVSRAAIGIKKEYRGGALPTAKLLWKFIYYKCLHPSASVCIAGFIANPKVYAMMCKYAVQVYPKAGSQVPQSVQDFKNALLRSMNLSQKELSPFVLKIHFKVALPSDEQEQVLNSTNQHIRHYLSLNPDLDGKTGVLVLLPVNVVNIVYACVSYAASALKAQTRKVLALRVQTKPALIEVS